MRMDTPVLPRADTADTASPSRVGSGALQTRKKQFRNINALTDLPTYRLPAGGWVSILHRISGAVLFIALPLLIWTLDRVVSSSPIEYSGNAAALVAVLVIGWALLHHLLAGIRHLWLDVHPLAASRLSGRRSASAVLLASLICTAVLAARLLGI